MKSWVLLQKLEDLCCVVLQKLERLREQDYKRYEWVLERLNIFYKPVPVYDDVRHQNCLIDYSKTKWQTNSLQPIMDEFLIFFTPAQENITQNHIERYNSIATYHFKYWNIFFNLVPVPVLQL